MNNCLRGLLSSQALICTLYIPFYCGVIPPEFRGEVSGHGPALCVQPQAPAGERCGWRAPSHLEHLLCARLAPAPGLLREGTLEHPELERPRDLGSHRVTGCGLRRRAGVLRAALLPQLQRYFDGALSNNLPFSDCPSTITVSPFTGTVDICPPSTSASMLELNAFNASFQFSTRNFYLGFTCIVAPSPEVGLALASSLKGVRASATIQGPVSDSVPLNPFRSLRAVETHVPSLTVQVSNPQPEAPPERVWH